MESLSVKVAKHGFGRQTAKLAETAKGNGAYLGFEAQMCDDKRWQDGASPAGAPSSAWIRHVVQHMRHGHG